MAAHGQLTVAAILVAAGSGERLGADVPKAFVRVAGRTLLEHAVARFDTHPLVRDVVVVAPADRLDDAATAVRPASVAVVAGGASRQASVAAGLAVVAADVDAVLVHDVARPFVPAAVIERVIAALLAGADAVIPARPVADTIKRVDGDTVTQTLDRAVLVAVQTPQGFRRAVLVAAHAAPRSDPATDDAALIEADGGRVVVVDGSEEAFKITTPLDLVLAEAVAAR